MTARREGVAVLLPSPITRAHYLNQLRGGLQIRREDKSPCSGSTGASTSNRLSRFLRALLTSVDIQIFSGMKLEAPGFQLFSLAISWLVTDFSHLTETLLVNQTSEVLADLRVV